MTNAALSNASLNLISLEDETLNHRSVHRDGKKGD